MRLFQSYLLFKIGLYATVIYLSTAPRNSGIPFENSNAIGYPPNRIKCLPVRGHYRPNREPNPENAGCMRRGYRIECLSVCGQYRPNRTPGTKRGVVAHVRTARQSRDCLRVRPSRAPPLFVAVRSALGPVLPTVARGALAALRRIPAPRGPLRPLRGSLLSGNLTASRQAHSSRFSRRKLAHPLASVRSMV